MEDNGKMGVLGGVKNGGTSAKNGSGCGKWERWCERIGCKGEVDVLGGVKDGDEAIYI